MEKNLDFYDKKTVLVTGHTGFKGSWLSTWLNELGAKVVGYSLEPPSQPSMYEALNLEKKVSSIFGDVRDVTHLEQTLNKFKPEVVFHLAAQPIVRRSYLEPQETYATNVMGTVNVLEAVRKTRCAHTVVVVTSDKCYENLETTKGYKETDQLGGRDPYSSSKACAELVVSAYRRSFFEHRNEGQATALASVRAGNVVGGGDWGEGRLVPDCIRALQAGREIVIRSPNAIRPWQHVLEPLSGYLLVGAKLCENSNTYASAWNFGPSENAKVTVEDLVKKIIAMWGKGTYRTEAVVDAPKEANLLSLDCFKAVDALGWKAAYSTVDALKATVSWYKKYYEETSPADMYRFTVKQISDYMEKSQYASTTED